MVPDDIEWRYFFISKKWKNTFPFKIDLCDEGVQAHAMRPTRHARVTYCSRSRYTYSEHVIALKGAPRCRRCEEIIIQELKQELLERLGAARETF